MAISIRNVEDVLRGRSLVNPSLSALNPNDQSYRALLLQPSGPILADDKRIGPLDLEFADTQATKFLELAAAQGHHLVVTPEYYLPTRTLLRCVQGATFPAVGALWVLGCESMTPAELERFTADCAGNCDVIFEKDTSPAVQGIYFDPVAYCFVTKDEVGNDRRVVLMQFKTIPSRDKHFFESKNLRCGQVIYQFKGQEDELALSAIICSDAFNVAEDENVRRKLTRFATLIHIQLNPKPRHIDYLRYRIDTFSRSKGISDCDIICLNWAENMVQYDALDGKKDSWNNESGSAWYISEHRCSSDDYEVESNEKLGLYYSRHIKHRHVLHFHCAAAAFELTVAKVIHLGLYLHDNNLGPKLDTRLTWNETHHKWEANPESPDCGLSGLLALTPRVENALASLKATGSRLQVERAIALSCGLTKSKLNWFKAGELDACKLGEDEVVRRTTLALDRDQAARNVRERQVKATAMLSIILNTHRLPFQIRDLAGGGAQVTWRPKFPHSNVVKDGSYPALVAYLGMEPSSKTVRDVSDAAFELLRLENNNNHKHRVAVCYHTMDETGETRLEFAHIRQLTDITHGGGSATSIAEGD